MSTTEPLGGWRQIPADPRTAESKTADTSHRRLPRVDIRRTASSTPPLNSAARRRSPASELAVDHHAPTQQAPSIPPAAPTTTGMNSSGVPGGVLPMAVAACLLCLPLGIAAIMRYQRSNRRLLNGDSDGAALDVNRCRTVSLLGVIIGLASIIAAMLTLVF